MPWLGQTLLDAMGKLNRIGSDPVFWATMTNEFPKSSK
jgi:hypothetical protein